MFYGPKSYDPFQIITRENPFCWYIICLVYVTAAHTGKQRMKEGWAVLQEMLMLILMSPSPLISFEMTHLHRGPFFAGFQK